MSFDVVSPKSSLIASVDCQLPSGQMPDSGRWLCRHDMRSVSIAPNLTPISGAARCRRSSCCVFLASTGNVFAGGLLLFVLARLAIFGQELLLEIGRRRLVVR